MNSWVKIDIYAKLLVKMDERELINHLRTRLEKPEILASWLNDDCEIIDRGTHYQLITVDTSSEKADFPSEAPPFEIGYFSTALSLSDIAACGGTPEGILTSVSVSPNFDSKIKEIYEGIIKAAEDADTKIFGGDSNSAGEFSLSVVAFGRVNKEKVLRRKTSKPGDIVGVSGVLDRFNFGYFQYTHLNKPNFRRMLRQKAPTTIGILLAEIGGVTSCIDLPDGLIKTLVDNTTPGLGFYINDSSLPVSIYREQGQIAKDTPNYILATQPAGDVELLFTVEPNSKAKIETKFNELGQNIYWIGEVTQDPGIKIQIGDKIIAPSVEGFIHKFEGYKLFQ